MASIKQSDWENRYSDQNGLSVRPAGKLLVDNLSLLTVGRSLDIACGEGRNSIFLAKKGYHVDAVDYSSNAIKNGRILSDEAGVKVNFMQADLEEYLIRPNYYDLIVNFNYLDRSIIPGIKNGLKKSGFIVFETFTIEQKFFGHPKNPDYLLAPNELLSMFDEFHIIYYREAVVEEEGKKKAIASLVASKK